jgi:hypothetical protein
MRMDTLIGFFIHNNDSLEDFNLKSGRFVVGLPRRQNTLWPLEER